MKYHSPKTASEYILVCKEDDETLSYGIGYLHKGSVRNTVVDISSDIQFVQNMINSFNRNHLDPVHLKDVIEDMIPS